jgi:single-strand DNA-binding protein
MGRLVAEPELRHTPNDVAVTSFTLAVDRSYVKSGTERQTDFIDVVAWRGTAEFICRHFRKGQMMAVHGSIQTRTYTDKDGNKRKAFEIVADDVSFADSKKDNNGSGQPSYQPSTPAPAAPTIEPDEDDNPAFVPDTYEELPPMSDEDLPF